MADANLQTQPAHVPWEERAKSVFPMPGGVNDEGHVLACLPAVTAERLRPLDEALTTVSTASPVDEDRESRRHSSGRGETR